MNVKKLLIASGAVYIVYMLLDYVIHAVVLMGAYEATSSVWRPMEEMKMSVTLLRVLVYSLLFVYIFTKGYEGKGVVEGLRYGLLIGLIIWIPHAYTFYNVLPIPYSLALQWWVYGTIQSMICGAVIAMLYKPAESS